MSVPGELLMCPHSEQTWREEGRGGGERGRGEGEERGRGEGERRGGEERGRGEGEERGRGEGVGDI